MIPTAQLVNVLGIVCACENVCVCVCVCVCVRLVVGKILDLC